MGATLALILPLGLASAISPVMLSEQTLLMAGSGGRRAALGFAAGVIGVTVVLVGAILLFGRAFSLPTEPKLSASLDLAVGLGLLLVATLLELRRRRHRASKAEPKPDETGGDRRGAAAVAFGAFSMATNFTSLPLVVAAAKEVSGARLDAPERIFVGAVLVVLASLPAWLPPVLTAIAPRAGTKALDWIGDEIKRHGEKAVIGLIFAAGLYFTIRGVVRLVG